MRRRNRSAQLLAALALVALTAVPGPQASALAAEKGDTSATAQDRVLRVYNNNIENLVVNNAGGTCTRISGPEHLTSMLVDDSGRAGTAGVLAPDILIVQQVRGTGQAEAYADQLSAKFGYPAGTYGAVVAWSDPEPWGSTHKCSSQELGDLKKKQTNGIIWNKQTLSLAAGDISKYWSAGWLKPGTSYQGGAGCTLYKPPNSDPDTTDYHKWKRTSAIAARFTIKATGTTVFAATMHLPQENRQNACAGDGYTGIADTGIHLGADATSLMNASTIRIVGIDANRTGIAPSTLSGFGMTGYGSAATSGSSKIDYLFIKGGVQPSPVDHTVSGTRSNHLALYGFITY
ncbi:hypothetical protein [Micromonospora peucetia]|uniref:Uncharacterized protein n=1 Tax=Micromonospora peucetia TaxID=47871 RepID=A0A1C6W682_9ACTN|nr:hypothetical protein [Micromonospora peucetia]WSA33015.1 hypothetical protein OIE14_02765 [Micromonospora peucetia]SCL74033.1 hypothetical protein GA0070608_6353 [Micromonospora peucetia]